MSTVGSAEAARATTELQLTPAAQLSSRLALYVEVIKPRIAVMALVTVTLGYAMGSEESFQPIRWMHALLGIALVACSSSALNQWYERRTDARMQRTAGRPLPSGKLGATEVFGFGILSGLIGLAYLFFFVNVQTTLLAVATLLLYTLIYTPLKRHTAFCTSIGAIPGALPPILGWAAAGGALDERAFVLFGILFLWQFPHFLAIAWLYREQYEQAGLRMLPEASRIPRVTGLMSVAYALVLIPVSLMPSTVALAGDIYWAVALVLGLAYLHAAIRFMKHETVATARRLIYTSLIYLPLLLLVMTWDHLQLLR